MVCDTLGANEKQFWQMVKPKQTIKSGSHFILNGKVVTFVNPVLSPTMMQVLENTLTKR